MHPLSFRKFLRNAHTGEDVLTYMQEQLDAREPLLPAVHNGMRSLYLQHLIVGGVPEAVNTFLETHDLNAVRTVQQDILASTRDDFGRCRCMRLVFATNRRIGSLADRMRRACPRSSV